MEHYEKLEAEITELPSSRYLNAAIQLSIEPLKLALAVEAKAWKTAYGRGLNEDSMTAIVRAWDTLFSLSMTIARSWPDPSRY